MEIIAKRIVPQTAAMVVSVTNILVNVLLHVMLGFGGSHVRIIAMTGASHVIEHMTFVLLIHVNLVTVVPTVS